MKINLLFGLLGIAAGLTEMVEMSDGVKLHTIVDLESVAKGAKATAILDRSPYGEFATELLATLYAVFNPNHAGVRQDMRGTKLSGGNFTIWHHATQDTYDTMSWITNQSWSNGKVQLIGASADGISALEVYKKPNPATASAFIIWSTAEAYPILYPGGAYRKSLTDFWMKHTVKNYAQAIATIKAQEDPRGEWWDAVTLYDDDAARIAHPIVFWAGWYDIFLLGNLNTFDKAQTKSDPSVQGKMFIVIDPLGHCQEAGERFPNNTILGRSALPIWLSGYNFGGKPMPELIKPVSFYVMGPYKPFSKGVFGNYWTTMATWPSFISTPYYLWDTGVLATEPQSKATAKSYKYDPAHPVDSVGGNNLEISCGPKDQRPVEQANRTDVLTFTSAKLTDPLAVTGPLTVSLAVSSDRVDTDFTAKLTDVYPDGSSILIQDGVFRMRWRDPFHGPQQMVEGEVYPITISLWNTSYVFNPGHAIRVSISSSNYPRFDANPNNGLPLDHNGGPMLVANNTIYMGPTPTVVRMSALNLPVVDLKQLPEVDVNKVKPPSVSDESVEEMLTAVLKTLPTTDK